MPSPNDQFAKALEDSGALEPDKLAKEFIDHSYQRYPAAHAHQLVAMQDIPLTMDQEERYIYLVHRVQEVGRRIDGLCPKGRQKSLVMTLLEEVALRVRASLQEEPEDPA